MPTLLDQFGRPVKTKALLQEEATPSLTGVRNVLSDHPSRGLTPQRLTAILLEAEEGDATRYLELAEDMEERDLNYLAQLGTRKRAVAQLEMTVVSASDSPEDVRAADLIREVIELDSVQRQLFHILDAVGKGYSVSEICWELSEGQWWPERIVWRDPRWFAFDRTDGTTLKLREGAELRDLTSWKYIQHIVTAKSGLPIRGGLARSAAWAWLFKNFSVKDWVAFAEVYGQPYRVGKYQPSATDVEKGKLLQAVASIGSDAAAIIPDGMVIEFIEAARSGSIDLYERLSNYLDAQVTKAVLGQTLTSDVGSGGGSRALGEVHNEVRHDIMRSDAMELEATLNRDLVRPVVDLNLGRRKRYPKIRIGLPDELTTQDKIDALVKVVPFGMVVETSEVRDLLGFAEPEEGAETLRPQSTPAVAPPPSDQVAGRRRLEVMAARTTAHAAITAETDSIDQLVADALDDDGWEPVVRPVVDPLRELLDKVETLEELRDRLPELLSRDVAQLHELLARTTFGARLAGLLGAPVSDQEDPSRG